MKAVDGAWRRRPANHVAGLVLAASAWWMMAAAQAAGPMGPSDRPEAYFNGSSYIRLTRPFSLKQLVGLSYRTCVGGELFSQRFEGYTLHVTALYEQVVVSWARPGQPPGEQALRRRTLDNHWHWVALRYRPSPPSLLLQLDQETQVVSNVTQHPELLSPGALEAGGAVVLLGNVFSGCLHEGPQLEFHAAHAQHRNVVFGTCPLSTDECKDRKDVLRIPPKDHCYNEPCMRHGTCISRHDRYECHCTARYTGNNCEVDAGDPCLSQPCRHGARCVEDARGDYTCICTHNYHGRECELEVSRDPQCLAAPCRNNASCVLLPGSDDYSCVCAPGFTGRNCETDVDECAASGSASGAACQHGGRCLDAVNDYTCDCTATGYTGPRCETNVNECLEPGICGHGVCYDTYGSYVCACQPSYTGDNCEKMSMCLSGPCGSGGACVEEGGGFRCVCARGFLPPLCTPAAPAPATCEHLACPPHAHCLDPGVPNSQGVIISKQAICVCDVGYFGVAGLSPNCTSVEAACAGGVCQHGGACSPDRATLNCSCAPGYTGVYCEQAVGAPGGVAGGPGGVAGPPVGGGADDQGITCASQPCVHATHCVDTPTGFHCECAAGWGGARCAQEACAAGRGCARGVCRDGLCDTGRDCRAVPCPHGQECVRDGAGWRCAAGVAGAAGAGEGESPCASSPCHNGTCVALDNTLARCQCPPGVTGRFCELDVDECALRPKICNHGVCVNVPGSYQCYCRPGYTGDSCEQDIDECLSAPCKNGGSCQNLENNYECTCMVGFEGKDCSVNIDECLSNPCAAGSSCVDGVASYSCVCQEGVTGEHCELDIDDCQSAPCQHGGVCSDRLAGYSCACAGTGYTGAACDLNIDECAAQPCQHAATCLDQLNDYRCVCHPAYTGKNCEIDIEECASNPCKHGGACLERSAAALYRPPGAPPLRLPPPHHALLLPNNFYLPFSEENAAGFTCVCVAGTMGDTCEVNVDECASSPCVHGKCVDGIGAYTCDCSPGYEGTHCEQEINECLRYTPCQHGRCYDGKANYYCLCEAGWGGRNCSVVLTGCRPDPCQHHGSCLPWLLHETEHRFNCSCTPGHYGTTCEKITTMSLEKSSYAEVNTSREEGYDISFRFKTTLGSGLLAMGRGLTYFFLELSNGRLNLHSSLLNKWEGVFIGSNLNDSNWQKVFVTINSTHLVLAANEEQTIYPISQNEAFNASVTSFPSTRLGTAGSSYAPLTHGPNFFIGCFQDVVVNSQWVLPEESPSPATGLAGLAGAAGDTEEARTWLAGVLAACPRVPQCAPSPCRGGGTCHDHWTTFQCSCPRPQLGDTCQYNYTAATFGHESTPPSLVRVAAAEWARRAVHAALDISMFIRTRKPTGVIFHLGSLPKYGQTDETLVGASLKGGELLVHLRFNQTPEDYTVGGTRLDNGYLHLIQVVRNSTLVQVKLNGTEYFRKSISAAKQLDAQVLYLGGPPPPPAAPEPPPAPGATTPAGAPLPTPAPTTALATRNTTVDTSQYFKGVIQDVQISNGVNVSIVEFFPLSEAGLSLPPAFGSVVLEPAGGVLAGAVSDAACESRPCLHHARCSTTWNDYTCACPRGYKGKQCAEVEFCQLQGCPLNSKCRNLQGGYECISNATFDGVNTTLAYKLSVPRAPAVAAPDTVPPPDSLLLTYRTKTGGTLLYAYLPGGKGEEGSWFSVGAFGQAITVSWRLASPAAPASPAPPPPAPAARRLACSACTGWTTLKLTLHDQHISGAFVTGEGGEETAGFTAEIDVAAWQRLMLEGDIYLGGVRRPTTATTALARPTTTMPTTLMMETSTEGEVFEYSEDDGLVADNVAGEYFKGCMGAVYVGGLLLPFFTAEELFVGAAAALLAGQPHYALRAGRAAAAGLGCLLCLERDCRRGGHCRDVRSSYACACVPGYTGDYCEIDIDECESNECKNNATCRDGVAAYTCECPLGYSGQFCETDIDECASAPCLNNGTCTDSVGAYSCACAAEWRGADCAEPAAATCADSPCAPRALCRDLPDPATGNKYTCECSAGWAGPRCDSALCQLQPCLHGHCDQDADPPRCVCSAGYGGADCSRAEPGCGAGACQHAGLCSAPPLRCDCTDTGYTGARCETDVDECALGLVSCGPGECRNLDGSYTCLCAPGFCGNECALLDPCVSGAGQGAVPGVQGAQGAGNWSGPCEHGGRCEQRCAAAVDYRCYCVDGWGGKNCSQQMVSADSSAAGGAGATLGWALAAALVLAAALAAGGAALSAQARRKRATRGTYSPSGQEYCNTRNNTPHTLKPPPEERLI